MGMGGRRFVLAFGEVGFVCKAPLELPGRSKVTFRPTPTVGKAPAPFSVLRGESLDRSSVEQFPGKLGRLASNHFLRGCGTVTQTQFGVAASHFLFSRQPRTPRYPTF